MKQHKMMYLDTRNLPASVNINNVDDTFNIIYNKFNKEYIHTNPIVIDGIEFKTIKDALDHPKDPSGMKVPNYWAYVANVVLTILRNDDELRRELISGKPIVAISVTTSNSKIHSFKSMKPEGRHRMYVGVLRSVADVLKKYPDCSDLTDASLVNDLLKLNNNLLDDPDKDIPGIAV